MNAMYMDVVVEEEKDSAKEENERIVREIVDVLRRKGG